MQKSVSMSQTPRRKLPPITRFDRPQSVRDLEVGHVVLAFENDENGWWEAVILEKQGEKLVLGWNGCPDQPEFTRSLHQVALMCPQGETPAKQ